MQSFTVEQLKNCTKEEMIGIVLQMQQEYALVAERVAVLTSNQFGRKTEKMGCCEGQLSIFNEAEAETDNDEKEPTIEEVVKTIVRRKPGTREKDLSGLPVRVVEHTLETEKLVEIFGEEGWKRLPDQIYRKLEYTPAVHEVVEHHVAVYASKKDETMTKAHRPAELWGNSIASPSLVAAIMNGKYVNHMPLNRIGDDLERTGITIRKPTLANWMITASERYLGLLWERLQKELVKYPVIQADETGVKVSKDGRPAGALSWMWLYRNGELDDARPIILFEYQKTRSTEHPVKFLNGFTGTLVCDGYSAYSKLEKQRPAIETANCWAHARRHFANVLKAAKDKKAASKTLAHKALKLIGRIYDEDKKTSEMSQEDRVQYRLQNVLPLVEAFFAWVREHKDEVPAQSETGKGFTYCLNQEDRLKVFLRNGLVPMDNSAAERAIRPFTVGRKNWVLIDTTRGADSSAIIYSLVETAKANNLRPYYYLKFLLTEIPKHIDDHDLTFLEDLLPWSPAIPEECRKSAK